MEGIKLAAASKGSAPEAPVSARRGGSRLRYLDLFRGLAVFFMLDAHITGAVVRLPENASRIFHWHNLMFNLPAPGFLFAAGLSFGMNVYSRWDDYASFSATVRNRLLRLGEVLFLAYLLHIPYFSLRQTLAHSNDGQWRTLIGWDVLQCIGYTALLMLLLARVLPARRAFLWVAVALTAAIAFGSSWLWEYPPAEPWWLATILTKKLGSNFPFFPYAGFLTAGTVWGYRFAESRNRGASEAFLKRTLWIGAAAVVLCLGLARLPLPAPYDDFWSGSPVFFFLRVGLLCFLLAALERLESRLLPVLQFIVILGSESLVVYFVHLILVYGSPLNRGANFAALFRDGVGFWTWLVLLAGLTAAMTGLAVLWGRWKRDYGVKLDRALWAAAGILAILFVLC